MKDIMPRSLLLFSLLFSLIGCGTNTTLNQDNDTALQQRIDSIALSMFQTDTITLIFVGDVMQHKPQINAAKNSDGTYNYTECFQHLAKEFKSADLTIANLETTLTDGNYSGYPMFSAPKDLAQGLKDSGVNILITANNHSLDRFTKGVRRTIETLDSLSIPHLGTYINQEEKDNGHPYYVNIKKKKTAFFNYTYGTNGLKVAPPTLVNLIDTIQIKADLAKAKQDNSDINIVCIHWGEEYFTKQNKNQVELGKWLIANGATHVIGSHPHVIQPIEIYKDEVSKESNVIAYSLGNFISNMSKPHTDGGMILKLQIIDDNSFLSTQVSYSLVWVGKPIHTQNKNYILYPSSFPLDSLNKQSQSHFKTYFNLADKVMKHNHKEVRSYFIQ